MKRFTVLVVSVTTALSWVAGPAHAATNTTFTLAGGNLSITVQDTATLSIGASALIMPDASGQLGSVTVNDLRAAANASWTASVLSSAFTNGTTTVAPTGVSYNSGAATGTTGSGTRTVNSGTFVDDETEMTAFSLSDGVGNNSTTWNPTVTVDLPNDATAGEYSGTITHSVA